MKSALSKTDFKNKLSMTTKVGNPNLLFTPLGVLNIFRNYDKEYFGNFDDRNFKLTSYSTLYPIPFIIKGNYEHINRTETRINYEIIPIKFTHWIGGITIAIFALVLILISSILFGFWGLITSVIISMLLFIFLRWINGIRKKQMENGFRKTFKIIA